MAKTSSGATALMAAAEGGRVEVVRVILEKATADGKLEELCNEADANGKSAWDLALEGKHKAVCQMLKNMGDPKAASAACVIS